VSIRDRETFRSLSGLSGATLPLGRRIEGVEASLTTNAIAEVNRALDSEIKNEIDQREKHLSQVEGDLNERIEGLSNQFTEPMIKFFDITEFNPVDGGVFNRDDDTDPRSHGEQRSPFYWDGRANAWLSFESMTIGLARNHTNMGLNTALRHEDRADPGATGQGIVIGYPAMIMSVWGNCGATATQPDNDAAYLFETGLPLDPVNMFTIVWPNLTGDFHYSGIYYPVARSDVFRLICKNGGGALLSPPEPKVYISVKYRVDSDVGGRP
jgi:hypothetical protein